MNILITNGYSLQQKGDTALLIGTIKEVKKAFVGAQIQAQVEELVVSGQQYEGVPIMDSLTSIALAPHASKLYKALAMAYVLPASLVWAWSSKVLKKDYRFFLTERLYRSCHAIYQADLIVPVAGGYVVGRPGMLSSLNLLFVLLPIWIAHILHKPVIHFSQSIGPLANSFQRFIVNKTLTKADLIITRESLSTQFAIDIGVDPKNVTQSIDVGFLFKPDKEYTLTELLGTSLSSVEQDCLVGITTKVHLRPLAQAKYEKELALFADWLCAEKKMIPIFIPQITSEYEDDRIINRRVRALMKHSSKAILVEKNLSNYETKALIEKLQYMIGTRFHSVIYALTGCVPAIAIEYEHKTSGIMSDLDLKKWVIKMDDLKAENLSKLFDSLVLEYAAYVEKLYKTLPSYIDQSAEIRWRIQEAYKESQTIFRLRTQTV